MAIDHAAVGFVANYLIVAALLAFAIGWSSRQWLRAVGTAVLAAALAVAIAGVLGLLFYEPRPFVAEHYTPLIQHAADSSFPSDHLSVLGAITAASWPCRRSAGVFAACISALVAMARVVAGVHYPIDVIFGFVLGLACAAGFWGLLGLAHDPLARVEAWLSSHHLRPGLASGA